MSYIKRHLNIRILCIQALGLGLRLICRNGNCTRTISKEMEYPSPFHLLLKRIPNRYSNYRLLVTGVPICLKMLPREIKVTFQTRSDD